ncbi:MAG: SMC-Scp complex subunit ScpB [Phycisphaerae bacterium]
MTEDRHTPADPAAGEAAEEQYQPAEPAGQKTQPPREPDADSPPRDADETLGESEGVTAESSGQETRQAGHTAGQPTDPPDRPAEDSDWDDPQASRTPPSDEPDEEDEEDSGGDVDSHEATHAEIDAVVEAVLFATSSPISPAKIAQVAELPNRRVVKRSIRRLNDRYEQMGCSFRVEGIAGGYQMLTLEQYDDVVSRLFKVKSDSKLSQAAMETLSIIAYRQPIIRADIEAIRGVSSGEMVRKLMEKNLVKIVGRAEVLGRPMLYGTTRTFLEVFGLEDIDGLPRVEELRKPEEPPAPAAKEGSSAEQTDDGQDAADSDGQQPQASETKQPTAEDANAEADQESPAAAEASERAEDETKAAAEAETSDREPGEEDLGEEE